MAKEIIDDRFKKFGSVSFISMSRVNDFIDYLDKGKLMGNRCTQCGRSFFRPEPTASNAGPVPWHGSRWKIRGNWPPSVP